MRWLAFAMLLVPLSGCLDHGCWDDGRSAEWTQPGLFDAVAGDWDIQAVQPDLPPDSVARFGGRADWIWLRHDISHDEHVRYGDHRDGGFLGGILRSSRSDASAAALIEDFAARRLGVTIDGHEYLEPRQSGDPARLIRGAIQASKPVADILAEGGQWQPQSVGAWAYHAGGDRLEIRVDVANHEGAWPDQIQVDAGDRVRGPYVRGEAVPDDAIRDAATQEFARLGLPEPTFQGFEAHIQQVCT